MDRLSDFEYKNALGAWIGETFKSFDKKLSQNLAKNGIQLSRIQYLVLKSVADKRDCSQNELAIKLQRNKSSLKRIVDTLEQKQYITRNTSNEDRRKCAVSVTDSGLEVLAQVAPHLQKMISIVESGLTKKEIETTKNVLQKIQENIHNS
jgi:DNA-binding MarR family transcriptional regulator